MRSKKSDIELKLGLPLHFQELEDKKSTNIGVYRDMTSSTNEIDNEEWKKLIDWGAETMKKFTKVLSPYLNEVFKSF